jgi:hypothetical protein
VVKLLPCDHEVMGSSTGKWKQPLAEMQGKAAFVRPKVVGPFPGPCVLGCPFISSSLYNYCWHAYLYFLYEDIFLFFVLASII